MLTCQLLICFVCAATGRSKSLTAGGGVERSQGLTPYLIAEGSFAGLSRKCAWSGGPTEVIIGHPCRRRPKEHQRRTKGTPKDV